MSYEEEPIEVDRAREEGRPSHRLRGGEPDGPVYPPTVRHGALKVGERIIYDGVVCEVIRVNACAAYVRKEVTRTVTLTDSKTGEERSFVARDTGLIAISADSIVERAK